MHRSPNLADLPPPPPFQHHSPIHTHTGHGSTGVGQDEASPPSSTTTKKTYGFHCIFFSFLFFSTGVRKFTWRGSETHIRTRRKYDVKTTNLAIQRAGSPNFPTPPSPLHCASSVTDPASPPLAHSTVGGGARGRHHLSKTLFSYKTDLCFFIFMLCCARGNELNLHHHPTSRVSRS